MDIISLQESRESLFQARLRQLYRRLDATVFSCDSTLEGRLKFFRQAQGEFLFVLRLKNGIKASEAARFINVPPKTVFEIEQGKEAISDRDFFRLCLHLGGSNEVSLFIEKLETALKKGARNAEMQTKAPLQGCGISIAHAPKDNDPRSL